MSLTSMFPDMRILYTAEAIVRGGRSGHGRTSDGRLELDLCTGEIRIRSLIRRWQPDVETIHYREDAAYPL